MSGIPQTPNNFIVQTANGQNLVSWDLSPGATSYQIQRSLDNVTYSNLVTISGSPLATSYLDTTVSLGVQYFYQAAATNINGTSFYTQPQSAIPVPTGEMSLSQIRLQAMQRADRVNSQFLTTQEWNVNINKAMFELYDLLVTCYEDYFLAPPIQFVADGSTYIYALPNGFNTFLNANMPSQTITPPPFYKLMGVDLALNNATNAYVTINKFNFIDRNRFVYPNTASTIYGVFNLQYRVLGSNIEFIPTPSAGQAIRLWYIPRMTELLQDTDTTSQGISGWIEYVIVRAAKYALDKEESDSSKLDQELLFLKARIEETASNRDSGMPDTISNTNQSNWGNGWNGGRNGPVGGFGLAPVGFANYLTNHDLTNSIFFGQGLLGYVALIIGISYFLYLYNSKFSCWVKDSWIGHFSSVSSSSFKSHVSHIIELSSKKQMRWINTTRIVTFMTNVKSFWNRTVKKAVGYATSYMPFSFNRELSSNSIGFHITNPDPALVPAKLINLTKKSSFHEFILANVTNKGNK